jgi:hypothetical protein
MSRRRFIAASVLICLLAAGAVVALYWPRATAITRANAAAIQKGMTLAEVEAILGGPPRDETTGPVEVDLSDGNALVMFLTNQRRGGWLSPDDLLQHAGRSIRTWQSDRTLVLVYLDADQRVLDVSTTPMRRTEEGVLAMLRRWLHL